MRPDNYGEAKRREGYLGCHDCEPLDWGWRHCRAHRCEAIVAASTDYPAEHPCGRAGTERNPLGAGLLCGLHAKLATRRPDEREAVLVEMFKQGASRQEMADRVGLSAARVTQILQRRLTLRPFKLREDIR